MPSSHGVSLALSVAESELAPGNFLHGEVRVKVDASHTKGVVYEAVRLVFHAVEHSCVWDDQGEFDALLNEYTSSRVYLDRHVTLAGFKTRTEDAETAAQCKQEMMFLQHCATPYATVAPTKRKKDAFRHFTRDEFVRGGLEMAAPTTTLATGGTATAAAGDNHREPASGGNEPIIGSAARPTSGGSSSSPPQQRGGGGAAEMNFPVLMPGTHTFPFMFRLPPWLPPSFYYAFPGARGELKYSAFATMLFPGNGAGSCCHETGEGFVASVRAAQADFNRVAAVPASALGGPVLRRRDGTLGRAGNMEAPLTATEQSPMDRDAGGNSEREDEEEEDGEEVTGDGARHRLPRLPHYSPADLTTEVRFDVLSVMPRRQLVAEYYQIDTLNLQQRQSGPVGAAKEVRQSSTSSSGDDFSPRNRRGTQRKAAADVAGAAAEAGRLHDNTHLALSSLYQTFRCGWMNNLCCLQHYNALEAEVLVVGARTVLLADEPGASHALGVRAPDAGMYSGGGAGALNCPLVRCPPLMLPPETAVASADVPWPVGGVTLRVRVRNHCPAYTVRRVRVELKARVEIFKSLSTPHTFPGISYSSFDYTEPIPPANEALFDVRLGLTPRFRRHETDSEALLPPPGVRTANMTSNTFVQVSFPDMHTYVEEEEETNGVVIMAETVDLNDEVLELPVRYS